MASDKHNNLIELLEKLNGYKVPIRVNDKDTQVFNQFPSGGIGFSQFNELQLSLGFNRVSREFFQYLLDETVYFKHDMFFKSIDELEEAIDRFLGHALFFYGSIEHGFEVLSVNPNELELNLILIESIPIDDFKNRHDPIHPIEEIDGKDTYYLGHLVKDELDQAFQENPDNPEIIKEYLHSQTIIDIGKQNYFSYLASDHLDVYIATSMRAKEDYYLVNKWVKEIFNQDSLKNLKLRWFDPTQAFCNNRIDKGLFEALMLKRAECTVYFVQESDTFGKDSELASTLAQGKPVIAFVPKVDVKYMDEYLNQLKELYPEKDEIDIILDKLREYNPQLAWVDKEIQNWVSDPSTFQIDKAKKKLLDTIAKTYDRRASLLSEKHPLGIQVCLKDGVANGVLVVRDLESCARIIERVIRKTMRFYLVEEQEGDTNSYFYLKEEISNCIYRLATGDKMLTNTFWNFYKTSID